MAISDWYPLLGWNKIPNFGFCHTITDHDEFRKSYVEPKELIEFRKNLLETLDGSFETMHMRILGKPGTGKTTFLYSLIRLGKSPDSGQLFNKYFLHVFHVNRARADDPEPYVMEEFLGALENYFADAGFSHEFDSINAQNLDTKRKLSKAADFFKENKNKFKKVLIIALDDVDLLDLKTMRKIFEASVSHLETVSIKKLLFLREETFDRYDADTKRKISQFFPDARPFPCISLFDVVEHRIKNTSGSDNPMNPFLPSVCSRVQATFDDSLRESLPALKLILENSFPASFNQNKSIEFIQNYLENAAVTVLIKSNRLPNLHSSTYRLAPYPIAIDMLALMSFIQDEGMLIGATNHAINSRRERIDAKNKGEEIKLPRNVFGNILETLIKNDLAKRDRNAIHLTPLGRSIAIYCSRKFYNEACITNILKTGALTSTDYSSEYQLMSFIEVNHEDIARIWTTAARMEHNHIS